MSPFDSSWLIAAVGLTAPLVWAALGELISERGGVINIGLEGMILIGAFGSFWVTWLTHSAWLGVLGALGLGVITAAVMAFFCVEGTADQIVVGLGIYILAGGATSFAYEEIFNSQNQVIVHTLRPLKIPLLADIPGVGKALFDQVPLTYAAFLAVPLVYFLLWRTAWGVAVRAAGELPEAVEAGGISVRRARWFATLAAGAGGGLAGALLTVGSIGVFGENMSAGRGFIALAAVVFGRWRPLGVLGACAVFGGADALQLRLQAIGGIPRAVWLVVFAIAFVVLLVRLGRRVSLRAAAGPGVVALVGLGLAIAHPGWSLPSQIWLLLPYVLALVVLAGLVGRTRVPTALGIPYRPARASG